MAQRDAYLDHLASVPLFAACSKRELQKIAKASDELGVAAGRVLVSQGETGRECYVIVSGSATVKRANRKVAMLGPGECVGELALLDHGPRTATVVAETDMTVLVLGSRQFAGVLDEVPTLSRKLLTGLASRVRELDSKLYG
jgi:CRP/FNR family transcriptional regulator, cyclic AMP receptor protein